MSYFLKYCSFIDTHYKDPPICRLAVGPYCKWLCDSCVHNIQDLQRRTPESVCGQFSQIKKKTRNIFLYISI